MLCREENKVNISKITATPSFRGLIVSGDYALNTKNITSVDTEVDSYGEVCGVCVRTDILAKVNKQKDKGYYGNSSGKQDYCYKTVFFDCTMNKFLRAYELAAKSDSAVQVIEDV